MEILNFIIHNFSNLFVFFGMFGIVIETSPKIRWNPYSTILNFIGKKVNEETNKKVENLTSEISNIKNKLHEDKKKEYSIMISNFASDLKHGEIKSESQFIAIIELCDEYVANGWNGKIKLDTAFIKEEYIRFANKVKNGDFVIKGGK